MEILGHATLAMTMNIYSDVTEDLKRDAADRMNRLLGRQKA
jgi:integrase